MGFLKHFITGAYHKHRQYNQHDYGLQGGFTGMSPIHHFLRKGKKLLYIFIAVAGLLLLLLIVLLVALSPLILSSIDWVYHNGISGIVKLMLAILDKLWKGAGI